MNSLADLFHHTTQALSRRTLFTTILAFCMGLGLSACEALQDQEYVCSGFDEQRTTTPSKAQQQGFSSVSTKRLSQSIDFHVRRDYVLVKSFRALRSASVDRSHAIEFKLQAPKALLEGSFDPSNGMLSYNESHQITIDGEEQTTISTGVYRCSDV